MNFETLLKQTSVKLKKLAKYYNTYGTFSDEDDLYQEMLIYLWQHYKDGLPEGINESYIINGCKFHILNQLRKEREKSPTLSLERLISTKEARQLKDMLSNQDEAVDRRVERKLIFEQIRSNGFTRRQKEVLSFLLRGFTVREIGTRLGISHVMVVKLKKRLIEKWQRKNKVTKEKDFLLKRIER